MPRSSIAWTALAVSAAISAYGFVHEKLWAQQLWTSDGVERWLAFSAVFWIAAAALLWKRPASLLPATIGFAFLYSEWWCWRFFNPLAPIAVLYFLGSCFFLGRRIFRRIDPVVATLAGLGIWIFILFAAARFPVNRPAIYAAAFALPYLAARREKFAWPAGSVRLAILIYVLAMLWIVALKPEVSYDALAVHLAIPQMIAENAKFAFDIRHYVWELMPIGGDLAFSAVYLLGGEMAARLLNFALLVLISAMVFRAARRWLSVENSALAAALFASTPVVQLVSGSLFVENAWAAFVCGGALALWEGEIFAAALLFGAALSVKLLAAAFIAAAAIAGVFLWRRRPGKLAAAGVLLAVVAAPPYLNSWWETKNPIFPYSNQVFRSPQFVTTAGILEDARFQQPLQWDAPYNLTFRSPRYVEGQKGAAGFQYFLLLLPMLALLGRKAPWLALWTGIAGGIFVLAMEPNLRYVYAALPLLSIGIAWLFSRMPRWIVLAPVLIVLNVWFLAASGWYHRDFAVFTAAQLEDYRRSSAPERKLATLLNRIAPGEPVAAFGVAPVAGLHAKAYLDTWRTFAFFKELDSAPDAGRIAQMFRRLRIRYLITPVPAESNRVTVNQFVDTWTAPSGQAYGRCEIRVLLAAPVDKPPADAAVPASYDDLDPRIEYTGAWLHDRQFDRAFAHSLTYSDQPGDRVKFFFRGASIAYIYTMAANRGMVEVRIDGAERARIDLYSRETRWQQQTVFSGLGEGVHSIELTVMEDKHPQSAGRYIDVDRFVVSAR